VVFEVLKWKWSRKWWVNQT